MIQLLLSAVLGPLVVSADLPVTTGTQLSYRGSVEARAEEQDKGHKTFDLTLWILQKGETGADVLWLVDERGRGEFPWFERFGRLQVDSLWRTAAAGPALLYDRGDGRSVVPIALPMLAHDKPLAPDVGFNDGKLDFRVERAAKVADKPSWKLSGRDALGPKRTVSLDQHSPLVLAMTERVIMGRGEEHQLKLDFVGSEQLAADQSSALGKLTEKLLALRGKLNQPARTEEANWKSEQLQLLGEQLPPLFELAAGTPLARLHTAAKRDLELQAGRHDAVAELGAKFDGHAVGDFSAKGFGDQELTLSALRGQVTVLHFWDYRDEPLKEPYGQVGYLDFIYHRRKAGGLQVYGVAVDGRLGDEQTRAAAERSVKKLIAFMNLSYPVLLDSGPLVKQFGDPRLLGANLPLFVVIGPDQKIIHYHVGHYEVHQDQGLKELDQVVLKALESK
ncbi:MAG TPA: TlpA disulfide reductase family protein [Pirellulales bacterium]|nr:TlpA disulfide reductase family protein [Pirellulales bacterium]